MARGQAGRFKQARQPSRLRFLMYTLTLTSASLQLAIAPLLPSYVRRFGLDGLQQGALLAATGLATLAVSLPAGALADRFGARRLTLLAGWVMALAAVTQAAAPSFTMLLVARLMFGAGYGVVWTAGLAWLEGSTPGDSGLGGTVAAAGVGGVAGPALVGVLTQFFGAAVPLLLAGLAFVAVTVGLSLVQVGDAVPVQRQRTGTSIQAAFGSTSTVLAAVGVVVAGIVASFATLVSTVDLHSAGVSAGGIGMVFAASGGLFIIGSVLTTRAGKRLLGTRGAFGASALLTVAILPAMLGTAAIAVIGMLCVTAMLRAVVWTVSYPLGAVGAEETGSGLGVVMGVLNGIWALTAVVSPLAAGALIGPLGSRATFGVSQVLCLLVLAVGAYVLRSRRGAVLGTGAVVAAGVAERGDTVVELAG